MWIETEAADESSVLQSEGLHRGNSACLGEFLEV